MANCGNCKCLKCDMPVWKERQVCHCPLKEGQPAPENCGNKLEMEEE